MKYAVIINKKIFGSNKKNICRLLKKGYKIDQVCHGPKWCGPKTYFYISRKKELN